MIAGMPTAVSVRAEGPDWVPGRDRRTFGNRSPTVPAARITHTALVFNAPAARAAPAMQIAVGERRTWRPNDQEASRIKAMTTGPTPATAPCSAGIEWYRK